MMKTLLEFSDKDALVAAWVKSKATFWFIRGEYESFEDAERIAKIMVKTYAVYVPHRYRGGWVIRGFGFSTERIGKYVKCEAAGLPELV